MKRRSPDCPDCGTDVTNVQGRHHCPDCAWTGAPLGGRPDQF